MVVIPGSANIVIFLCVRQLLISYSRINFYSHPKHCVKQLDSLSFCKGSMSFYLWVLLMWFSLSGTNILVPSQNLSTIRPVIIIIGLAFYNIREDSKRDIILDHALAMGIFRSLALKRYSTIILKIFYQANCVECQMPISIVPDRKLKREEEQIEPWRMLMTF